MVDDYPFVFEFIRDCHKTQKMCEEIVSKNSYMLKCCIDRYTT